MERKTNLTFIPLLFCASLHAAEYRVTRFDDPAPVKCAADACSLREAVIAANANPGDDTIELQAGTFTLSIAGIETLARQGDLDIRGNLTITGATGTITYLFPHCPSCFIGTGYFLYAPLFVPVGPVSKIQRSNQAPHHDRPPGLYSRVSPHHRRKSSRRQCARYPHSGAGDIRSRHY